MPTTISDDSAVVREVLSGRTDAFRALVERYFATVRLVALAKTGNVTDAEDVAQETFIKAYETLGVLRNRERLAPWLVSIARNLAISLVRRRERERRNAGAYPVDPLVHPDHERRETLDAVARQVEALPENLREVVLLHYFEGLKCREIGERLDMNTNAVVKRLTRGREMLGDRLLREWGESRAEATASRVHQVMGAIAVLPRPDWGAQLAGVGAAALKSGGLVAMLLGPPLAVKVITAVSIVVLGVLYVSLNPAGGGDGSPTDSAGTPTPAVEEGLVAAVASGVGKRWKQAISDESDGPVTVAVEPPPPPVPMAEVGFVSGVVVDINGTPVRDAVVWVGGARKIGKGTSNPNGDFRANVSAPVAKIEAGEVRRIVMVTCSVPGYVPQEILDIPLGTTDVQIVLMRPSVLAGTVVDAETGTPVSEFTLTTEGPYRNPETGESIRSKSREVRSSAGEFRLELPYGIEKLAVTAPGYVKVRQEVGLGQGESQEDVVIPLERGGVIRGIVMDKATSEPISSSWIRAEVEGWESPSFGGLGVTGGYFELEGLPRDRAITLVVDANNYMREVVTDVALDSGEELQIYLGRGGTMRGRVTYQGGPPPGSDKARIEEGYCRVNVVQHGEGMPEQRWGYVRPDGTYEVSGLGIGSYLVQAFYWPSTDGFSVSKLAYIRDGEVTTLDIDYDEQGAQIEVAVEGEGAYKAIVDLRAAADPANVLESRIPYPGQSMDVRLSHDFNQLESGDYVVRAYHPEREGSALEQTIRVGAGQKAEVHFDFADVTEDVAMPETGGVEALDGVENTLEASELP